MSFSTFFNKSPSKIDKVIPAFDVADSALANDVRKFETMIDSIQRKKPDILPSPLSAAFDDDEGKDCNTSWPAGWPPLWNKKDWESNNAIAAKPFVNKNKPNVVPMAFPVVLGHPKHSNQRIDVIKPSGGSLSLWKNPSVTHSALAEFNDKIRKHHNQMLPRFIIQSGDDISTLRDSELLFYGLAFDGVKIKASFIHYHEPQEDLENMESVSIFEEIDRTCAFFILGECEVDEAEESITGMEIEAFGYVNPSRNIDMNLYSINDHVD
jgi:hypothetical protein